MRPTKWYWNVVDFAMPGAAMGMGFGGRLAFMALAGLANVLGYVEGITRQT